MSVGGAVTEVVAGGSDELAGPAPAVGPAARLERVAGMLLRRLRPVRAGDLTRSQASLLVTVRDHGPLSLADLAAHEAVQAPTASRAVDLLVRRGLLRREVDPADHRRQLIDLAGDAVALLQRRSRDAVTALTCELQSLDDGDRTAIVAALPALERLVADFGRQDSGTPGV